MQKTVLFSTWCDLKTNRRLFEYSSTGVCVRIHIYSCSHIHNNNAFLKKSCKWVMFRARIFHLPLKYSHSLTQTVTKRKHFQFSTTARIFASETSPTIARNQQCRTWIYELWQIPLRWMMQIRLMKIGICGQSFIMSKKVIHFYLSIL